MVKTKTEQRQTLTAKRRTIQGTRPVKRLRGDGVIPGVVYGKQMEPVAVTIDQREMVKLLHSKMGEHALVTLRIDDGKPWEKPVLVKAIQHDPVDGRVVHVDFHAIALTERLKVKVPVALKGDAMGVKQEGGILEHFLREVEVECLPTEIPAHVEFDVSALKIGDTVHVRDLTPPANTKITSDPAGVIASIQKPKEEKPEEAAASPAEPEVIREKKEEAEGETGEAAKGAAPEAKDTKKEKEPKS